MKVNTDDYAIDAGSAKGLRSASMEEGEPDVPRGLRAVDRRRAVAAPEPVLDELLPDGVLVAGHAAVPVC